MRTAVPRPVASVPSRCRVRCSPSPARAGCYEFVTRVGFPLHRSRGRDGGIWRCRGRRRSPWSSGAASTSASASCESFRLAPVGRTARGQSVSIANEMTLAPSLGAIRGIWSAPRSTIHGGNPAAVNNRSGPIDVGFAGEPIQGREVHQIPDSFRLPVSQASPACHTATQQFLGQHLRWRICSMSIGLPDMPRDQLDVAQSQENRHNVELGRTGPVDSTAKIIRWLGG